MTPGGGWTLLGLWIALIVLTALVLLVWRLRLGVRHAPLLIGAFFGGGILLLWADVLARGILDGGRELPVGVVTSLLGGPFFGIMLRRR